MNSGRRAPFGSAAAAFVAEFTGLAAARSGRSRPGAIVERAATLGISAQVGWELECIVLDDAERLIPAMETNRCWSALTPAVHAELFDELTGTLEAGGAPVHHTCAELGGGCLELRIPGADTAPISAWRCCSAPPCSIYGRYKRFGDDSMDDAFFPIIWREDGYRLVFIEPYLTGKIGWAG